LTPVGRVIDGSGLTLRRDGLEVDVPTLGWEHRFD
jgi:hypothetical protein